MKKTKFTEGQIAAAVRQAESGVPVVEICRRLECLLAGRDVKAGAYRWNCLPKMAICDIKTHLPNGIEEE